MKTDRKKNTQSAYLQLRRWIMEGRLAPGSQLLEAEAAEMLQLSRTPVREAMIRLEQDGIVTIRPRHGMLVRPVTAGDMREIYTILTALEGAAASLVARRGLSKDELADLRQTITDMDAALEQDDRLGWAQADERFHHLLVQYCGNKRLQDMVEQISAQAHQARMTTLYVRPKPTTSTREHEAVVDAIMEGDEVRANQIHQDHRETAGEVLVSLLEKMGRG